MEDERKIMTIDIGNSGAKVTVFEGDHPVAMVAGAGGGGEAVSAMFAFHHIDGIIYSCVGADTDGVAEFIEREWDIPFVRLTSDTPLPIGVEYGTRGTLGADRIAAAAGVDPSETALVVDAGTALTVDMVSDGVFRGGNISPGLWLRFSALNKYTSKLPMVEVRGDLPLFGNSTETAIRAGVVRGLVAEIVNLYHRAEREYGPTQLIITGGDASLLEPLLREYGVEPHLKRHLVAWGLLNIFRYNYPLTS